MLTFAGKPTVGALLDALGARVEPAPAGEKCRWCDHLFYPHIVTADRLVEVAPRGGEPRAVPGGGSIACPVPGCGCHSTWSLGVPA